MNFYHDFFFLDMHILIKIIWNIFFNSKQLVCLFFQNINSIEWIFIYSFGNTADFASKTLTENNDF